MLLIRDLIAADAQDAVAPAALDELEASDAQPPAPSAADRAGPPTKRRSRSSSHGLIPAACKADARAS
jgi:hypothetical protein